MVRIVAMWEHGWNVPIIEINQWEMLLRSFKINKLFMCPVSGLLPYRNVGLEEHNDLYDVIKISKKFDIVFVDERGDMRLSEFKHPKNALYVFGKGSSDIYNMKKRSHKSVRIETPSKKPLMFGSEACAIVLYDRFMKER